MLFADRHQTLCPQLGEQSNPGLGWVWGLSLSPPSLSWYLHYLGNAGCHLPIPPSKMVAIAPRHTLQGSPGPAGTAALLSVLSQLAVPTPASRGILYIFRIGNGERGKKERKKESLLEGKKKTSHILQVWVFLIPTPVCWKVFSRSQTSNFCIQINCILQTLAISNPLLSSWFSLWKSHINL